MTKSNERYSIISVNLSHSLINKINFWIYTEKKCIAKRGTLTTSINTVVLDVIDAINENRSELLRDFVNRFLTSLQSTFKEPFNAFASKGSFLRSAIYFCLLKNVETTVMKIEQKNQYWIKYNGKTMSKNEFLGNTLVKFGSEMLKKVEKEKEVLDNE